jgi:hypothetical protein
MPTVDLTNLFKLLGTFKLPKDPIPLKMEMPTPGRFLKQRVIDKVYELTGGTVNALTAWIQTRESEYCDGPGQTWSVDICVYAACRDYLCFFTGKKEKEL